MALPLIAAGIAARAVAKKLATRAVGGIVGAGSKTVNPVYRNTASVGRDGSKTVKINSNPNTTPAGGTRNPSKAKINEAKKKEPVYNKFGNPPRTTMHINSNPMRGK